MKPDFGIINEATRHNRYVIEVDTSKASYQGKAWKSLGDYGKRKFENLLVMTRMAISRTDKIKVLYV